MQGGAGMRTEALLPEAPRARTASGRPQGRVKVPSVTRNDPFAVARACRIRGPSSVTTVTVTRSRETNPEPATTSGDAVVTVSRGTRSARAASAAAPEASTTSAARSAARRTTYRVRPRETRQAAGAVAARCCSAAR